MICRHQFCAKSATGEVVLVVPYKESLSEPLRIRLPFGFCDKHKDDGDLTHLVTLPTYRTIIQSFHEANLGEPDIGGIKVEVPN